MDFTYICFCFCYAWICLCISGHHKVKAPTLFPFILSFNDITDYKGDINGCHFSFFLKHTGECITFIYPKKKQQLVVVSDN